MKGFNSLITTLSFILAVSLLIGCSDFAPWDDDAIAHKEYGNHFEEIYGKIAPDQTWDLTSYNLGQLGLLGGPSLNGSSRATRAAHTPIGNAGEASTIRSFTDVKYEVEEQTLSWLNTNLKEGVDHRSLGTSFNLVSPQNDFLIIPIYQGNAGLKWDLHLVAGSGDGSAGNSTDYNIWSKSQNIFYDEKHNKDPYGEEFYYFSKNRSDNAEGDFVGGIAQQDPTGIYLGKAFNGISDQTSASITFKLPANMDDMTVDGYFVDKDDQNTKLKVKVNNEEKTDITLSANTTTTIDISSMLSNPNLNNLQDLVFKITNKGDQTINGKDNYKNAFMHYTESDKRIHIYTKYDYQCESDLTSQTNYATGHTINRTGVKSKAMKIDGSMIPNEFIMYLDITYDDGGDYAVEGEKKMSNASPHMMLALTECNIEQSKVNTFAKSILSSIEGNCQYMVLGCEDTNIIDKKASWGATINSDWDYNDIVFLVVGMPVAPKIKEIYKKRYMIEDLGSTFDFDFNDIVVDVTMEKYLNADGTVDETETNTYAAIKHLCGTIPFQLKIGDKVFGKVTDPTNHAQSIQELLQDNATFTRNGVNWNPDQLDDALSHIAITGWDPKKNNISIKVWPQAKTSDGAKAENDVDTDDFSEFTDIPSDKYGAKGYTFPSHGDVPYIIAVDQTVNWMPELQSIPKNWFQTWSSAASNQYDDYNNGGGSQGGNQGEIQGGDDDLDLSNINKKDFKLTLAKLAEAGATDDNQKIRIVVETPSDRKDWGCGKIWDLGGNNEKIELKGPDGNTTWNFEFTLAQIKEWAGSSGGIYIKVWDDYKVTKVEVIAASSVVDPKGSAITGTTIARGTTDLYDGSAVTINDWDKNVAIAASKFNNAKVGDVIIVHTSGLYEESQAGLRENTTNWPAIADGKEYFDIEGDYELTIDQSILGKIKSSGLIITGKYYTIEDVTLRTTTKPDDTTDEPTQGGDGRIITVVNTPISANNIWEKYPNVSFSDFGDYVVAGNTITVEHNTTGWLNILYGNCYSLGDNARDLGFSSENSKRTLVLDEAKANSIKQYGICFQGENSTITKITISIK